MPSLHVDAPCSLLVPSGWLKSAGPLPRWSRRARGGRGRQPVSSCLPELRSPPLLCPCPTGLRTLRSAPHHFGENEGVAHEV